MNKAAIWGFTFGIILIILGVGVYAIVQNMEPEPAPRRAPARTQRQAKDAFPKRPPTQPGRKSAANQNQEPARLDMTRALANDGEFAPGGTLDVTVTLTKQGEEPVRAIGIVEHIPDGWTYLKMASEQRPDLTPSRGHAGRLEFVYFSIPEFPVSFTYRVQPPESATEPGAFRGQALYRTSGPELHTEDVKSVAAPAGDQGAPQQQPKEEAATRETAKESAQQPEAAEKRATGPELTLTRSVESQGYTPGEPLEVALKLDYSLDEDVTALAVQEVLPPGWTFGRITGGDAPAVPPNEGTAGTVSFIWIQLPEWPIEFNYTVNVPQGQSGEVLLEGYPVYRTGGGELRGNTTETELSPAS